MTFDSNRFENLVRVLENKYFCPKLRIKEIPLTEQQLKKVRFDETDLHFEHDQDLESGTLTVPAYYTEDVNLPLLGNKFLRYHVNFNKGNLMKITVEKGYWKLKDHDLRFREYVVPFPKKDRHTVCFNFWKEEERWAMIRQDKWQEMCDQMESDLNEPLLKELEHEFHEILREAAAIRYSLYGLDTTEVARQYLDILQDLFWYLENVPKLWYIFNIYDVEMYERIQERLLEVEKLYPDANNFITQKEQENEPLAEIDNTISPLQALDFAARQFLLEGYEVIRKNAYPSLQTIFTIREEFKNHANTETLRNYEELSVELSIEKRVNFIWLNDIITKLNLKKR